MHLFDVLCYKASQIIRERKRYAHYHINLQIEKSISWNTTPKFLF